jgi:hypothetical protein
VRFCSPTNYYSYYITPAYFGKIWPITLSLPDCVWQEKSDMQTVYGGVFLSTGTSFTLTPPYGNTSFSFPEYSVVDRIVMLASGTTGTLTLGTDKLGLSSILSAYNPTDRYLVYKTNTSPQKAILNTLNLKPD